MSTQSASRSGTPSRGFALAPVLRRIAIVFAALLLVLLALSFWLLRV